MVALYAWTTRLDDGSPSFVGAVVNGMHTPLCAMSLSLMEVLRPVAENHAKASGQRVYLERFDHAETLATFPGDS
jgi:hypothetical protein